MVLGLLWIVGAYALGAALVHAVFWYMQRAETGAKHYVLYTLNDGPHVEWAVRSLILFYWLQGRQVLITVIDEGSTDETLDIVQSLARRHMLHVRRADSDSGQDTGVVISSVQDFEIIHIRLRQPEDLQKLPLTYSIR